MTGTSTVTSHSAVTEPQEAIIVVVPAPTAVILPFESIVATDSFFDVHVIVVSTVAFSGFTSAVIVLVSPLFIVTDVSLNFIDSTSISVTVTLHVASSPLEAVTVIVAVPAFTAFNDTFPSATLDVTILSSEDFALLISVSAGATSDNVSSAVSFVFNANSVLERANVFSTAFIVISSELSFTALNLPVAAAPAFSPVVSAA